MCGWREVGEGKTMEELGAGGWGGGEGEPENVVGAGARFAEEAGGRWGGGGGELRGGGR